MSIQRYRRKPERRSGEGLTVARYEPGRSLDGLHEVARMADSRAEMAEVALPSGTVLLVKWERCDDDHPPRTEWEVIEAGHYLAFSDSYYNLFGTDDADLRQWYEGVPEGWKPGPIRRFTRCTRTAR